MKTLALSLGVMAVAAVATAAAPVPVTWALASPDDRVVATLTNGDAIRPAGQASRGSKRLPRAGARPFGRSDAGRIGEWALLARREGPEWWLAAMTDWDRRAVDVPLAFLGEGTWEATVWSDGANAGKVGTDYRRTATELSAAAPLRLDLAPGGGAAVRLRRK